MWYWWETVWQDLRFAARLLARSPGFTVTAILCLAIGIGITTAIFTNLRSTVFRELPAVRNPQDLVRLQTPMPYSNWEEFRDRSGQFKALAAFMGPVPFEVSASTGEPERIWGHLTTPNYFLTLGVSPLAGRMFGPEEDRPGSAQVAVISQTLSLTRFGGATRAVGRTVRINGQPVTIVGVAPENFVGASPMLAAADIWIPTTAPATVAPELQRLRDRQAGFDLIGRLNPGRTLAQAEAALEPIARNLELVHNDPGRDRKENRVRLLPGGRLFPIRDEDMPKALGLPIVLAGLVLFMSCSNVANMLVARGAARRREIAVRLSVGGKRGRIVRQLLTESVLMSGLGGIAGLGLAYWQVSYFDRFRSVMPGHIYMQFDFDWQALIFSGLVTLSVGVLFGLVPALHATGGDITTGLKPAAGGRQRGRRWLSLRNVLVANQVVASMVLLLLTGFIVVGMNRASSGDFGFEYRNLYLFSADPVRDGYDEIKAAAYFDRLPERLELIPGVVSASGANASGCPHRH